MGTLQLSFHGPFLYRFMDKEVEIYAPKCPRHAAGLFTAKKEFPLTGRHRMGHGRRYHIQGPVFVAQPPAARHRLHDPGKTILDASKAAKPAYAQAYFCLVVPVPQVVVPLIPGDVEVIYSSGSSPTGKLSSHATGLRFYYQADLSKPVTLVLDGAKAASWVADFDAPDLGHEFADVEVRYASVTAEDQEHHDAIECFDHLAGLAGVDWWLCFDESSHPSGTQAFVKNGNDCRAPVLILQ